MADEVDDDGVPDDPRKAFAYLVGRCCEGYGAGLIEQGRTEVEARNAIIHHFLDFAAGEACRIARSKGREPDRALWTKTVDEAFDRAVKRTGENDAKG